MITYTGREREKKRPYMEFCSTLNNTADTQLCFTNTEEHVCADDSVLRKHKEMSVALPVSAVVMSASHSSACC